MMIFSTLAVAFTLITQSISYTDDDSPDYFIGDPYNLTWPTDAVPSSYVDIVLYYGDDLSSNWTIASNVSNTGSATKSIQVGEDLSNSVGQLLIENGTMGQFRAEAFIVNYTNGTEKTKEKVANLTTVINVYQTVTFVTPGRAFKVGSLNNYLSFTVYVRKETYDSFESATFVASLVSVNEDGMTWSTNETLATGPTAAPTAAPTTAPPTTATPTTATPTTASPTTAAPTTASPTTASPTTSAPTTASPTTASPTTAAPTTAAPTTSAPTTAAPTTASPTTAAPTTAAPTTAAPTTAAPTTAAPTTAAPTTAAPTTASPTTASPTTASPTTASPTTASPTTASPTTASPTTSSPTTSSPTTASPTRFNRRLLASTVKSLRDVTLGLENDDDSESVSIGGCDSRADRGGVCSFQVNVSVPTTATAGGPYLLNVGLMEAGAVNSSLQYYAINNNELASYAYTKFILYNASEVSIDLKLDNKAVNGSFYKYEPVSMDVSLGDALKDVDVYVALERLTRETFYYTECGANVPSYYTAFGWRTWDELAENATLPEGSYQFELFWAGYDSFAVTQIYAEYFKFEVGSLPFASINDDSNGTQYSAVTIKNDKLKYAKGGNTVEFMSSFNEGTLISGYLEQCNYTTTPPQCDTYMNSSFEFEYEDGGSKVAIDFPNELYDTEISNNNTKTWFRLSTKLCDNETTIDTTILLEIGKSSKSKSSTLSAGAIVGIVCAGVLVLGLAAWWLCMKKGGGDGYRELNE